MRVKIHREGTNILILSIIGLLIINIPLWLFLTGGLVWIPIVITVASVICYGLLVNFYRSPKRTFEGDPCARGRPRLHEPW